MVSASVFTFKPVEHDLQGATYYTPAYQSDAGVDYTLSSAPTLLTLAGNRFYDLTTARPYNPADTTFQGPQYTLTGPDGAVYQLSADRGVVAELTPSGDRLVFSDSGLPTRRRGKRYSLPATVQDGLVRLRSRTDPVAYTAMMQRGT